MDKKILDKIKKCLALSKSANEHEAAAALRQAQALMEMHGVSAEDVELSAVGDSRTKSGSAKAPPVWQQWLMQMVGDAFGCEPIITHSRLERSTYVRYIGINPHPEIAGYAYAVLLRQLTRGRREYLATLNKRLKTASKTRRADLYAQAWVEAASRHVTKQTVCEQHQAMVKAYKAREFEELGTAKQRKHKAKHHDYDAIVQGRRDGRDARLHTAMNGESSEQKRIG